MNNDGRDISGYFQTLSLLAGQISANNAANRQVSTEDAIDWTIRGVEGVKSNGGKLIFVGNGGSAGIASHLAIDYSKNGGIPALAFNDGASLTCLANDLGYENVFSHQITSLGKPEDMLVAISSSGQSSNILRAVDAAKENAINVLTLSGFDKENHLRSAGDMNIYVPSQEYGFVEIMHLTICHAVLDLMSGWNSKEVG